MTVDEIREAFGRGIKEYFETFAEFEVDATLLKYIYSLEQQLLEAREENENKFCCGNCQRDKACGVKDIRKLMNPSFNKCDMWQSDNLTKQDREV